MRTDRWFPTCPQIYCVTLSKPLNFVLQLPLSLVWLCCAFVELYVAGMSLKQSPPSLLASSSLLHKEGEKGKQKFPESTMVTVVCTEKGLAHFSGFCSCKERCCGVVLCCHRRIYNHWSHMDPWTELWEMSTKCKEFCKFIKRGTRSKLCVSTSLDKALKVNGPFLIISACVWPEDTRAETCKKTPNQPTRNNTPAQASFSVYPSQYSKNSQSVWVKTEQHRPSTLKDYYCLCMNAKKLPFLASLFLELL